MKKILIVEDDPFLLKVYEAKMAKEGFEARIAKDGEEVFVQLGNFTPDLILLDLVMPKKDGFEVLKELRSNEAYKNIPVMVTSNLGQAEDKQRVEALGVVDYMVKSDVKISQIIERVKEFFQTQSVTVSDLKAA